MRNIRSTLVTVAAVAAAAIGGAAIADAASSTSSTTTAPPGAPSGSGTQGPGAPAGRPAFPAHGSAAHEGAEKPATGTAADQAKAAAVKAAGGGTATDVTTDYTQNGYEVNVKKSDGSTVEIHLDRSFKALPGGRGPGGPGRPGAGGPPPGPPPAGGSPSVSG